MADEPEDDVLELDDTQIVEDEAEQQDELQGNEAEDGPPTFGDDLEELDEDQAIRRKEVIRDLRKRLLDEQKKNRRMTQAPVAEQPIEVGPRPTMEACEWDQARFDTELDAWVDRGDRRRQQDRKAEDQQRRQSDETDRLRANYREKMTALPYRDKDTVEEKALAALSSEQQAIIAKVAKNPALLMYALGKNEARLDRLAASEDYLAFATEIGRMEATLKTTSKGARPPEPERVVRGGTVKSQDRALDALEKEADRTGDRSKLIAYRASKK